MRSLRASHLFMAFFGYFSGALTDEVAGYVSVAVALHVHVSGRLSTQLFVFRVADDVGHLTLS